LEICCANAEAPDTKVSTSKRINRSEDIMVGIHRYQRSDDDPIA